MELIITSNFSSPWLIIKLTKRRVLFAFAVFFLVMALLMLSAGKVYARYWVAQGAPEVRQLIADNVEQQQKIRNELWQETIEGLARDLSDMHVRLWKLRYLGEEIASKLEVPVKIIGEDLPYLDADFTHLTECSDVSNVSETDDTWPKDGEDKAIEVTDRISKFSQQLSWFEKHYNAYAVLSSQKLARENVIPELRPIRGQNWRSSGYGYRKDPFTGRRAFHAGIDYAGQKGTIIEAAADGVVVYRGRRGNYGNTIEIYHGRGYSTLYAHINKFIIEEGVFVRKGEPIAHVGNTGRSRGPHLHFEVRKNGKPQPPNKTVKKMKEELSQVATL